MTHPDDHTRCIQLASRNDILTAQLQQSREHAQTLERQLAILSDLHSGSEARDYGQQLESMRQELISCLKEKDQLALANKSCLEKIEDLRYHNGELKMLNEKMGRLHEREIAMVRKEASGGEEEELRERERIAVRERERLERQLEEVARVAGEMEHYYMQEIRGKQDIIAQQQMEIGRLAEELEGGRTERSREGQLLAQYQGEVSELRGKVKFLINKIEQSGQEETVSKPSLGALSSISSQMVQSKMVQSNSSLDSFRVGSCYPAKESLTRRNTSGAKTPSKYSVTHRHAKPLQERNY